MSSCSKLGNTSLLIECYDAGDVQEGELSSTDWPEGCLGYAFNLVRPTRPGLRAEVLYKMMGRMLVFTSLELALAYAQFVTQASICLSIPTVDA